MAALTVVWQDLSEEPVSEQRPNMQGAAVCNVPRTNVTIEPCVTEHLAGRSPAPQNRTHFGECWHGGSRGTKGAPAVSYHPGWHVRIETESHECKGHVEVPPPNAYQTVGRTGRSLPDCWVRKAPHTLMGCAGSTLTSAGFPAGRVC